MLESQISDPGISVYHPNANADLITVGNALVLAKDYPVTVKTHFCMLVKKFYSFSWMLKKEKH